MIGLMRRMWLLDSPYASLFDVSFSFSAAFAVSFLLLSTVTLLAFYRRRFRYWSDRGIKGPQPRIPSGTAGYLSNVGWHKRDLECVAQFGKVYGTFSGLTPVLVVADHEVLKEVLIREFASFADRKVLFSQCISSSLIGTNGARWREQRTCLSPTFTSGKLKSLLLLVKANVDHMLRRLEQETAGQGCDVSNVALFGDLTMGVIASCAFATDLTDGGRSKRRVDEENEFVKHARRFFELSPFRVALFELLPESLRYRFDLTAHSTSFLVDLSREILRQRKQVNQDSAQKGVIDMLQLMLESAKKEEGDNGLTDEEIVANMILVLIAGYDTTKGLLSWTTYELARRPDIQRRLREEVCEVIKGPEDEANYEAIMSLKYLDAVLNESLRRYPPVVTVDRVASKDCEIKTLGLKVRKGDTLYLPIYAIHHQADYHPDPFTFDPERFMPGNKEKMLPCTFMPFMVGPRNCIGARFALLEAKAALVAILRRYDLSPSPRQQDPPDLKDVRFMLAPRDIIVKYTPRG